MKDIGYIVLGAHGDANSEDADGILWRGDPIATVFASRKAAQRAIDRTRKYGEDRKYHDPAWDTARWTIVRLEARKEKAK